MKNADALANLFDLFAVSSRVRIINALKHKSLCVTEITSQLGITRPATSQHLRLFRNAGIVKAIKRGFFVYYHLDKKKMSLLRKAANDFLKID
ncbi:MAG: helix-turn-helix transcriptional regulator [Sedimentisphaerales bacterium]|nr:helix-turn-helix transcriptional regulator [Sedimentisphaerales bacterium]